MMPQESKPQSSRPTFHADRDVDRLMAMVTALTQELAVLRDRLDTHERLLDQRALFGRSEVDAYQPSELVLAERQKARQRLIASVFRPVFALAEPRSSGEADYEQFVQSLEASPES